MINPKSQPRRPSLYWPSAHRRHSVGAFVCVIAFGTVTTAAHGEDVKTIKDCSVCPEMVTIPGGSFVMGIEKEKATGPNRNRYPPVRIHLSEYRMSSTEITYGQYERCVDDGKCELPSELQKQNWQKEYPIAYVTWYNAQDYANWLSDKTGKRYSLPSEAQWEYAALAENPEYSVFFASGVMKAKSSPANKLGLYGMFGNVSEWVQDCTLSRLSSYPLNGSPHTESGCNFRAIRGAFWRHASDKTRITRRSFGRATCELSEINEPVRDPIGPKTFNEIGSCPVERGASTGFRVISQ